MVSNAPARLTRDVDGQTCRLGSSPGRQVPAGQKGRRRPEVLMER
jgi:hypothetical protein